MNVVNITGTVSAMLGDGNDRAVLIATYEDTPQIVLTRHRGPLECTVGERIEARGRLVSEAVSVAGTPVLAPDGRPIHRSVFHAEVMARVPAGAPSAGHPPSSRDRATPRASAVLAMLAAPLVPVSSKEPPHVAVPELPWQ